MFRNPNQTKIGPKIEKFEKKNLAHRSNSVSEELNDGIGSGGALEHIIKIRAVEVDSCVGVTSTVAQQSEKDPLGDSHGGKREVKEEKKIEKWKRCHL